MEYSDNEFRQTVWEYYRVNARSMPWRDDPTFYYVLVSEIMLQQTQVSRVIVKFAEFINQFPTIKLLADVPLREVLTAWQGLGYNRRAKFLHEAARHVKHSGEPTTRSGLMALPGVGQNTAGAMMNYVYEQPTPYVETNIRTVFFHHFFIDHKGAVHDNELMPHVARTLSHDNPREWFWALMDYGSWLKAQGVARNHMSRHHKKQPALAGSLREMRSAVIRALAAQDETERSLCSMFADDERLEPALQSLVRDGLIQRRNGRVYLTKT